jgi:hypothetical protein
MRRLSQEQIQARFEALIEAAEHLRQDWTDDPVERSEGNTIADWLEKEALKWLRPKVYVDRSETENSTDATGVPILL